MNTLNKRSWASLIIFGLVGQIAWVVENMYFATLCQDIYALAGRVDLGYIFTTIMVIASALTATSTTFIAGTISDKTAKRKPFIIWGYIIWGLTIMLFALIPMHISSNAIIFTGIVLVIFDCIMTVAGSTSNDAAFNAWVTDITDKGNRGRVNAVLMLLPVFAVIVVFIGLGRLYNKENSRLFFLVLGAIPIIAGIMASRLIADSNKIKASIDNEIFYGFKKDVIKAHKQLYITLLAFSIIAISQQTFFSYLINFLSETLGFGASFVIPMAVILLGSALITGIFGKLFDKYGRKHFYILLVLMVIIGTLCFYLLQYMDGALRIVSIYIGGVIMMTGVFAISTALMANFQDLIPTGYEGRFQGIRMCFNVLMPMIIGPIISLLIGLNTQNGNALSFAPTYDIFLASSIVAIFALLPIIQIRKS